MTTTFRVAVTLACCMRLSSASPQESEPNWTKVREEAGRILTGMVRIDTSSPPGNETRAAEYIKGILARDGIESAIYEMEPGRGNLVARLRGSGKKRPLLLMGHTDVVGVEREKWTVDPFGGVVKDGYIYGRGASDDKGMTSACLEVFLLLHRLKVPLDRDVIFLAEAGEEGNSTVGIEYMVEKHWDKIECELALNEGGTIYLRDGRIRYVGVATTEKVPRGMRLVARGSSGHGSVPRADNAVTHLAAAVAKVGAFDMPMRLNETTRAFFQRLAKISSPEEAFLYTHLEDPKESAAVQAKIRALNPSYASMLRTSIVPTIIKGGFRQNVIPGDAEATLDVRAMPDEDIPAMIQTLRKLIADPAVEIVPPPSRVRPATPPSRLDTPMFAALEHAAQKVFPGVVTVPLMLTGATDSAQLRRKGVAAYGLGSVASDDDRSRVHGNDERLSVEGLGKFVQLVYAAVLEVAAAAQ